MSKNLNTTHAEIAHAIKSAKKALLKNHREGMDLSEAIPGFIGDLSSRFSRIVSPPVYDKTSEPEGASPPESITDITEPQGASWKQIKQWSAQICSIDGNDKVSPFLLLMSEIERSQFDRVRVDTIVNAAMLAGFTNSEAADKALSAYIQSLRDDHMRLSEGEAIWDSLDSVLEEAHEENVKQRQGDAQ